MQERLTEIEIRLAHLDQSLNELSDVVYDQQKLIRQLETTCAELRQRIAAGSAQRTGSDQATDEKPPHY